jgi:hypothetical protein
LTTLETFKCGDHSFTVVVTESCTIRTVTLHVVVMCGRGKEGFLHEIEIFKITEGDHVWNTLVKDQKQEAFINYAPCVWYLRICAKEFSREHPQPLRFGSLKKALRFSADNLQRPLNVRGHPHRVPYPGTTY